MIRRFFSDLKKYFRYSIRAAKAKLDAEVAGSYLNWIWWILNPLCFMLLYTFIFGTVFRTREPFFSVYIYIGLTMWNFFSHTINSSVKTVKSHKSILSKIYLPKFILIVTSMMVNGFKLLISFGVIVLMMLFFRIPFSWSIFYFIPVLMCLIIVSFSFSCFLLHLGVFIQDLPNIMTLLMRVLFYMTGIFYDITKRVPAPANYWALRLNPAACLLNMARSALLYGEVVMWDWLLIWFSVGLLLSLLGVWIIYRNENNYVKVI